MQASRHQAETGTVTRVTTPVYLDHAATTPMRPEAVEAMMPFLTDQFANPSGSHGFARRARRVVDDARDQIAEVIGCAPGEIVFTSGGTEADNAVILGAVRHRGGTAVCSAAEHHAVLHPVEHLDGIVIGVDDRACIDLDALRSTLRDPETPPVAVVSVMAVNNEIGTVSPLAHAAGIVRRRAPGAVIHTDAVQAACWQDLREIWPHVDAMSLSAHKFGGPKGAGIMVLRSGVDLEALILGGGQERDRRSGTLNVAGIVATAAALAATDRDRGDDHVRVSALRRRLLDGLSSGLDEVLVTVPEDADVVPGIAHVCFAGVESEALLFMLDRYELCASAASACASGALAGSHVLAAMGLDWRWAAGALRLSLGHTTDVSDIDRGVEILIDTVTTLRNRRAAARDTGAPAS